MNLARLKNQILDSDSVIAVAFSGGKDSIAMVCQLLDMGIDKERIHLHHHLVDGAGDDGSHHTFDWPCTHNYCQKFAERFGLNIYFSYREGGIRREIYRQDEGLQDVYYQDTPNGKYLQIKAKPGNSTRRKFPAVSANLSVRWCSSVVKMDVMDRIVPRLYPIGEMLLLTGERREESLNRSKYAALELHSKTKKRTVIQWRPILDLKESQVWDYFDRYSIQPHPAYMLGWSRCSCMKCIFNSPDHWRTIAKIDPKGLVAINRIERDIQFTMYSGKSILSKAASGKGLEPTSEEWVVQALSKEFTKPIEAEFKIPAGAFKGGSCGSV